MITWWKSEGMDENDSLLDLDGAGWYPVVSYLTGYIQGLIVVEGIWFWVLTITVWLCNVYMFCLSGDLFRKGVETC